LKIGKPPSPPTLARLLRAKAMSDALSFARLERSKVKELAKELTTKT
jgi:hypothetical protein